jgi:hypothetical protein
MKYANKSKKDKFLSKHIQTINKLELKGCLVTCEYVYL